MVAVEHHLARADVGDRVKTGILLDLHADGDALAVARRGLHPHQLRVVFAERLVGLELQADRFAGGFAFQRTLERGQQLAVAAVQVLEIGGGLELGAVRVVQLYTQGDDGVLRYQQDQWLRPRSAGASPRRTLRRRGRAR